MLNYCLEAIRHVTLPDVGYKSGGILPSEMLAFIGLCRAQNVTRIVESGRSQGYSTEVLAASGFRVDSIDHNPVDACDERLAVYSNLTLHRGSAAKKVPHLIDGRCALLLDGPKGEEALLLWKEVRKLCVLCGVHDASKQSWAPDDGYRNPCREHFKNAGAWFTDDEEYIRATEHLDAPAWEGTYASRREMTAHGFTLAILKGGLWTS